ncbi:Serine/threonine-protein kinase [Ceratobasidium sp. AG-Ba]|nr:Serine/threonine-protein kinase [Ceratobasidium sp. AG-Ba]
MASPVTASPPRLEKESHQYWPTRFQKEQEATNIDLGNLPNDLESIGPWILGDMIGKGSSGRVKLGKHKYSGKIAAIKIISKNAALTSKASIADMDARHQKALLGIHREIVIMKLINHPCIMSLYDLQETETEFYLALEYVEGGELFDYLVSKGRLSEPEALNYFQQIMFGLDYCHRFNISHRDLKPENILLDKDMNIKIADFGMAALEVANGMLETSCGSPHYASPEIVAGKAYHGASSDIWSCGVVLYALLTGRLPFDDPSIRELLQKVKIGQYKMETSLSPGAQDLIMRMLVVNPLYRITIPEIFAHPFFNGQTDRIFLNPTPPTLAQLSKPIGPHEFVEVAYLNSLQILFLKSRGDIERALRVRNQPNWEKAFLFLLRQYAERVREDYMMDDSDDDSGLEEVAPVAFTRRSARLQAEHERDVFADITARTNNVRRSIDARPHAQLPLPPVTRKRALTTSAGACAVPAVPPRNPARLVNPSRFANPVRFAGTTDLVAGRAAPASPSKHSREGPRAPSVMGPRPNATSSPTKARPRSYLESGPVGMPREQTGPGTVPERPASAMAYERQGGGYPMVREIPGAGLASRRARSPLPVPSKSPMESSFRDVVGSPEPTPFRSMLSPDPEKMFGNKFVYAPKDWSEEDQVRKDREVASKSTLSPHAAEFRLPDAAPKLVRKSKPAPLSLANPNWYPVSSASQPGTPAIASPRPEQMARGWFQNLFSFRPSNLTLFSTVSPELTRREATQVLSDLGVNVMRHGDRQVLLCHAENFRDVNGALFSKFVRFRIEIRSSSEYSPPGTPLRSPSLDSPSPYPVIMTITQEKGANSTLKAVYNSLRASWRLHQLISPMPVSAGSTMTARTPTSAGSSMTSHTPTFE